MRTITYAEGYSDYYQHPIRPFSLEKARQRHAQRKLYTAILEEAGKAVVVVEMCFQDAYCNVHFLDELGRWGLRYTFIPAGPGRLFLAEIAENTYRGEARLDGVCELSVFSEDGRAKVISTSTASNRIESKEMIGRLGNLAGFYELEPAFGEYDSLIREERGLDLNNVVQDAA